MAQVSKVKRTGTRVRRRMLRKMKKRTVILIGSTSIQRRIETSSSDMSWLMSSSSEKPCLSRRKIRKRKLNKRSIKLPNKPK
jgi:hypothetical protein